MLLQLFCYKSNIGENVYWYILNLSTNAFVITSRNKNTSHVSISSHISFQKHTFNKIKVFNFFYIPPDHFFKSLFLI